MNARRFFVGIVACGVLACLLGAAKKPKAPADPPPYEFTDAEKRELEEMKEILEAGIDVNMAVDKGFTLLHVAAEQNHVKVAEYLIEKGAKLDVQGESGVTPLHLAAEEGHLAMAELLIAKGAKVNSRDKKGLTPLVYAADEKRQKMVDFLRSKGGSGVAVRYELTAEEARFLAATKATLAKNADVNAAVDAEGNTRLHIAARNNYCTVAKLLLQQGGKVEARDKGGRTPLHAAAAAGHDMMVMLLMEAGADAKAKDHEGNTPQDAANKAGHTELAKTIFVHQAHKDTAAVLNAPLRLPGTNGGGAGKLPDKAPPTEAEVLTEVKAYVEGGGKVDAADGIGFTRLHSAASSGHAEVAKYLLDKGAKVDATEIGRHTPLHIAAQEGRVAVIELLLAKGANIEATTALEQTPLHLAADQGQVDAVKLLLKKGAKRDARDMLGITPLDLARATKITDTPERAAARAEAAKALGQ